MGSADQEKPLYTLLSATPSPYARKVRISLLEKGIPFKLQTEVPWDSDTQTPNYNPLEKLPVLIDNATGKSVYESAFILEWIEVKHKDREPKLIPADDEERLQVKEIEVVADGSCCSLSLALSCAASSSALAIPDFVISARCLLSTQTPFCH